MKSIDCVLPSEAVRVSNVAHLLLARATAREREIAVRGALGASRARLLRHLATESVLLAALGGAGGVVLAYFGARALGWLSPANLPRIDGVRIDGTVLRFAFGASLATAFVFGLVPAMRAAAVDLNRTLRATGSPSRVQTRVRSVLVVAEMALALVLLIGAGMMVRTFFALQQVRLGCDPGALLTFRVALPFPKYADGKLRLAALRETERRLLALPGVTAVGLVSQLPLTGSGPLSPYAYNEATARNWESETSDGRNVSPSYFRAMGTQLVAGRFFDEHDGSAGRRIIIDTTLAARAWPDESAIGKRLQVAPTGTAQPFAEVIGVVEHIRAHDLSRAVRPQIYTPMGAAGRLDVVIRTAGDPSSLAGACATRCANWILRCQSIGSGRCPRIPPQHLRKRA
jgi:predicted permease